MLHEFDTECPECGGICSLEDLCESCELCVECCECTEEFEGDFTKDELGINPEFDQGDD